MHLGKAGSITFLGSSGDIILDECQRFEGMSIRVLQIDGMLKLYSKEMVALVLEVDTKIFREKRKRINKILAIIISFIYQP